MKKYCNITLLFMIIISGCVKHKQIDFTSSETFFSSLNDKEIIQKENKENTPVINSLKINNEDKPLIKKPVLMNLSNYEKLLKQKIGFKEYKILKIFNNPNLKIKHGKVKNFQFHLKFCHLDLFF